VYPLSWRLKIRYAINLPLPFLKHGHGKTKSNQSCVPKQAILSSLEQEAHNSFTLRYTVFIKLNLSSGVLKLLSMALTSEFGIHLPFAFDEVFMSLETGLLFGTIVYMGRIQIGDEMEGGC
jgi:hypothetical protein